MAGTYLALGGNLGDVEDHFSRAISSLDQLPNSRVKTVSSIVTSLPVGTSAGAPFRNAVLNLETDLEPLELLKTLQSIENQFGRDRSVRWGPRPVDLDLVLYEDQILSLPELVVPHPACWYRRFVFEPMAEIASGVTHPVLQKTFGEILEHFDQTPLSIWFAGGTEKQRTGLINSLETQFPEMTFHDWFEYREENDLEPGLILWLGEDQDHELSIKELPLFPCVDLSGSGGKIEDRVREVVESTLPVQK